MPITYGALPPVSSRISEAADYVRKHIHDFKSRGIKINYGTLLGNVANSFEISTQDLRKELGWNKKPARQMRLKLR